MGDKKKKKQLPKNILQEIILDLHFQAFHLLIFIYKPTDKDGDNIQCKATIVYNKIKII